MLPEDLNLGNSQCLGCAPLHKFAVESGANGRRPTINACAGGPGGPAATAIKIAWSLNSWEEAWEGRPPVDVIIAALLSLRIGRSS
jgi:hypothetical protein